MATGKSDVGFKQKTDLFVKNNIVVTKQKVAAEAYADPGDYNKYTVTVSKSGYTPLGICGYQIYPENQAQISSGLYVIVNCYLSGTTITFIIRNTGAQGSGFAALVTLYADVLWVKN